MSFEFDMNVKRPLKLTDEIILNGLRAYAKRVGNRRFTMKEFDRWDKKPFAGGTVMKRFGQWRFALAEIGIEDGRARRYSPEDLVERLERVWKQVGFPPGHREIRKYGRLNIQSFNRRWGSVQRACQMISEFHAGKISRELLLRGAGDRPRRKRSAISQSARWRVMRRDGHRCVKCGRGPASDSDVRLEIDHIMPVSRGGTNEDGNLQTLCKDCNRGKSDSVG